MNIKITDAEAGITVREYLRGVLGYSSAMLKKLKFSDGGITVNGEFVTVRHVLQTGETLSLACEDTEDDTSPYITPYGLPLEIVYEDEYITAVNKPPFMPAHPSYKHRDDTVANALAYRYSDKPYVFRPVNRLDRDTSGVMLTANTRLASYKMYRAISGGMIKKEYVAVLDGIPSESEGTITSYIRRREGSTIEREECTESGGGKIAVTKYKVIAENGRRAVVLASPVTGRTHQLRVQFAGIGCPITGDGMYGTESPVINRQALHSYRSTFTHPFTGETLVIEAPLPDDIKSLCKLEHLAPETP